MEAVLSGVWQIQTGFTDVVLAGGVESMSNVPFALEDARWGARYQDKVLEDGIIHALHAGSVYVPYPQTGPIEIFRGKPYIMGLTAEFLAQRFEISREDQDEVALRSQNNAERATDEGKFQDEITPVVYQDRKKGEIVVDKDEHFRRGLTMEQLAKLPPSFLPDGGTVTAGNSSGINDGAAALIIMAAEKVEELGIKPLAKITGMGMGACEPEYMGLSPVSSVRNLFERTGMSLADFERIEINEAFAFPIFSR